MKRKYRHSQSNRQIEYFGMKVSAAESKSIVQERTEQTQGR